MAARFAIYRGDALQLRTEDTKVVEFVHEEEAWRVFFALIEAENMGKEPSACFHVYGSLEYTTEVPLKCRASKKQMLPFRYVDPYLVVSPGKYTDLYGKPIYPLHRFEHVRVRADGAWIHLADDLPPNHMV